MKYFENRRFFWIKCALKSLTNFNQCLHLKDIFLGKWKQKISAQNRSASEWALVRTFYLRLWPCVSLLPTGSGSRSRPSKETREVIDMGKMSAASLTSEAANAGGGRDHNNSSSSSRKGSFPLNGILKKMENKADQDNTSSSNKKSNTKKEAAGKQKFIIIFVANKGRRTQRKVTIEGTEGGFSF